jgi:hypothetical protein
MKTAGRENPNRWARAPRNRAHGAAGQNRSRSIKWAAKQEKFQPQEMCFFLTSTFIERFRNAPFHGLLFGVNELLLDGKTGFWSKRPVFGSICATAQKSRTKAKPRHFYRKRVFHRSESSANPLPFFVSRRDQHETLAVKRRSLAVQTTLSSFSRSVPRKFITDCQFAYQWFDFFNFFDSLNF